MKKFLKLFFSRGFWIAFIIFIELAIAIALILILELIFSIDDYYYWFFSLAVNIIGISVMIYIVNSEANSSYKITWLFVVGLFPYVGVFLYLLFGNKNTSKHHRKRLEPLAKARVMNQKYENLTDKLLAYEDGYRILSMSSYIEAVSRQSIYDHTLVDYYPLGDDAFPIMLEELKKAKHYIFLEYFIIEPGKMWNAILDILKEKAQSGVEVRLIYDDVGCLTTLPTKYVETLKKYGIKAFAFNRFRPFMDVRINNRDHRKIMVIDGIVGFTGGINLADEYINAYVKYGHWKDNAIRLRGQAVYGLTTLFLDTWVGLNGGLDKLSSPTYNPLYYSDLRKDFPSDGFVQPYGDIPFDDEAVGERVYLNILNQARKYVYITTPYLILDEEMENSLKAAARGGIQVIILTPHIPDKKIIFSVTRSYYRRLLDAGVKIYEYTPGFVHMKMFVSDDVMATVGTINLDYRSLYLHMECGVLLYRNSSIAKMRDDFLKTLQVSEEITPEKYKAISRGKRLWWAILRLFTPLM